MPMDVYRLNSFGQRAIELLEKAIGEIQDGEDALPTISAAEAILREETGELERFI